MRQLRSLQNSQKSVSLIAVDEGAIVVSTKCAEATWQRDCRTLQTRIEIESQPDENDRRLTDEGLDTFNASNAGPDNAQDLWVMARGNDGDLLGGLKGRTFYDWLLIDWLWCPPLRAARALERSCWKAEDAARERQCIGAYVEAFSFQAPDFYRSTWL